MVSDQPRFFNKVSEIISGIFELMNLHQLYRRVMKVTGYFTVENNQWSYLEYLRFLSILAGEV